MSKDVSTIKMWERFNAHKKGESETYRCVRDTEGKIFVLRKRSRRCGMRLSDEDFSRLYDVIDKDENEEWHKTLAKIEKRLEKSELWQEIKDVSHNLQKMTFEDYKTFAETRTLSFLSKYPFLYRLTEDGKTVCEWAYTEDWCKNPKVKSMYFGASNAITKERIKEALKNKEKISERAYANYDVSFDYDPIRKHAHYSEEYRGCGNGHYYLALDGLSALFYEDD